MTLCEDTLLNSPKTVKVYPPVKMLLWLITAHSFFYNERRGEKITWRAINKQANKHNNDSNKIRAKLKITSMGVDLVIEWLADWLKFKTRTNRIKTNDVCHGNIKNIGEIIMKLSPLSETAFVNKRSSRNPAGKGW